MNLSSGNYLGLCVSDRGIACAEVSISGGKRQLRRAAEFVFTPEQPLENAGATGQALATFLRQQKFRASRAVVGVPARWLIAVERELPPANEPELRSMLRLQAERMAVSESGEVVFDYAGELPQRGGRVLLVGLLRAKLQNLLSLFDTAGLAVVSVTSSSLALASILPPDGEQPMLVLGGHGAEIVWRQHGSPRMLRHVGVPMNLSAQGAGLGPLGAELRRLVALTPTNGTGPARQLLFWDGLGLTQSQLSELSGRLGLDLRAGSSDGDLAIQPGNPPAADIGRFAPSLALALAGARRETGLNFADPRLAPPAPRRISRRVLFGAVSALLLIGLIVWHYVDLGRRRNELDTVQKQLAALGPELKVAKQALARLQFARGYLEEGARPKTLDCLHQLTTEIRDDDPLWLTAFSFGETGRGQIIGRATSQRAIYTLRERLIANANFADVRIAQMSEVNTQGGGTEQSFTMVFTFTGGTRKQP